MSSIGMNVKVVTGSAQQEGEKIALVQVTPPAEPSAGSKRPPADVCCCIDISGSMSNAAECAGAGAEDNGLSLLDVAKHAVRTIIQILGPEDRLSLVMFDDRSEAVFPLMFMDEAGQTKAVEENDKLCTRGGTDIWKGINVSMDQLRDGKDRAAFSHLIVLTDGQTDNRNRVLPNLKEYVATNSFMPTTIATFGFGYNIDSELLANIATYGHGLYAFIPDAGFVGTIFVNAISNMLAVVASDVTVSLNALAGAKILEVMPFPNESAEGAEASSDDSGTATVCVGAVQFGQSRDVVVRMQVPAGSDAAILDAAVQYNLAGGSTCETIKNHGEDSTEQKDLKNQFWRCRTIGALDKAMQLCQPRGDDAFKAATACLSTLADEMKASPEAENREVAALLEDITGQSAEAVSKVEWFHKWGRHYLPSLSFAHKMQQCNNFKDPGVQVYGGALFESIRDEADDQFNKLPPPKPSLASRGSVSYAPVSMAAYNDASCG